MLFLANIAGVAMLVWFYLTAQEHKKSGVEWAIIGLIGYWLVWWLVNTLLNGMLPTAMARTSTMLFFMVKQIPALCGMSVAYLIRQKLISGSVNNQANAASETE
jgi:hypothetical protein